MLPNGKQIEPCLDFGELLVGMGSRDWAIAQYRRAIELAPGLAEASRPGRRPDRARQGRTGGRPFAAGGRAPPGFRRDAQQLGLLPAVPRECYAGGAGGGPRGVGSRRPTRSGIGGTPRRCEAIGSRWAMGESQPSALPSPPAPLPEGEGRIEPSPPTPHPVGEGSSSGRCGWGSSPATSGSIRSDA